MSYPVILLDSLISWEVFVHVCVCAFSGTSVCIYVQFQLAFHTVTLTLSAKRKDSISFFSICTGGYLEFIIIIASEFLHVNARWGNLVENGN